MRKSYGWLAGLAVLVGVGPTMARDPEVNPATEYIVTPDAGPWMVCVASYTGENAGAQAHDLVLEIRQKYKLPAFLLNRSAELRAQQEAELRRLREEAPGRRIKTVRIEDQFAVLVGGYKDMEAAHKAQTSIKNLPAPPENLCITGMTLSAQPGGEGFTKTAINPFKSSFVVHNPTVPLPPPPDRNGPDPDLAKFNQYESYSLLKKCPKPWTLVIATFQGASAVQSKGSGTVMGALTGKPGEQLAASELNAHNLAEMLQKTNLESYVLHTRYYSLVTVGSFSRPPSPSEIKAFQEALEKRLRLAVGAVKLMETPLPMQVPKS
jgi:hypothetical protein